MPILLAMREVGSAAASAEIARPVEGEAVDARVAVAPEVEGLPAALTVRPVTPVAQVRAVPEVRLAVIAVIPEAVPVAVARVAASTVAEIVATRRRPRLCWS